MKPYNYFDDEEEQPQPSAQVRLAQLVAALQVNGAKLRRTVRRDEEIVEELVQTDITSRIKDIAVLGAPKPKAKKYDDVDLAQMSLFDTVKDDDVLKELKELDLGNLTPIEALNTLYQLQNKLKNRW